MLVFTSNDDLQDLGSRQQGLVTAAVPGMEPGTRKDLRRNVDGWTFSIANISLQIQSARCTGTATGRMATTSALDVTVAA
jgi:hypothetical protein